MTSIRLYGGSEEEVASTSDAAWEDLGLRPGISDNGSIIAFYGDLSDEAAIAAGWDAGPGIFASVQQGASISDRTLHRLTGGTIPEDEVGPVKTEVGIASLGYDSNLKPILFDADVWELFKDDRVGVAFQDVVAPGLDADDSFVVSFMAKPDQASLANPVDGADRPLLFSDQVGLWTVQVDADWQYQNPDLAADLLFYPSGVRPVVQIGDMIEDKEVLNIDVNDPIANVTEIDGVSRVQHRGDHQLAFTIEWLDPQLTSRPRTA